ncbi:MAG: hypothetical protein RI990_98 [Planctomycetota bacterium]
MAVAGLAACEAPVADGGPWKTTIKGQPFTLTVSASDPTRQRGLGGVTEIPVDGGMAFAFPDAQLRGFWMKDCVIDMDIVYLDPLGYVTAVHTMRKEPPQFEGEPQQYYEARLPRYSSLLPAQFAIELRAGRAAELGIRTQDRLEVDLAALKAAIR